MIPIMIILLQNCGVKNNHFCLSFLILSLQFQIVSSQFFFSFIIFAVIICHKFITLSHLYLLDSSLLFILK